MRQLRPRCRDQPLSIATEPYEVKVFALQSCGNHVQLEYCCRVRNLFLQVVVHRPASRVARNI